ncbi:MAG: asparagine synthase (glutamine-hydrolyzing) [bacterium]|nr:asparagine synthase (glutamine-hydrolyzing) [bacterium]
MCGIVGSFGGGLAPSRRAETVRRMTATLGHRGPDGLGSVEKEECAFGFRRLAIMDPDGPSQPYANEDQSVWCMANAEIYNADELRTELETRGHVLHTGVDTEILPHLYEEHGADLVHKLNGMFALAIWDSRRRRLLLARDRAGEKPLFYWQTGGELVFASELRALAEHPGIPLSVDAVALRRYLQHDFFPAPLTPLAGVRKLPAGHLLIAADGETSVRSYWDLADHFGNESLARRSTSDLADELDHLLGLAVQRRSRSDVPIGVFLSGGIDSSTVLAYLAEQLGPGIPAFSLGHTDQSFDESRFARETAEFFGADFDQLVLTEDDLGEGLRLVAEGFDEPLGDASIIPTHLLSRHARRKVKVVLSGEGADELFAGYPTYLGHRVAAGYRKLPGGLRKALVRSALRLMPVKMGNVGPGYLLERFAIAAEKDLVERHHTWFGSIGPGLQQEILSSPLREGLASDQPLSSARDRLAGRDFPDDLSLLLYTDFTMYLQDDLLTKVDRATMLASLEARAPFLDHDLAEFVAGLPSSQKLSGLTTKAILRRTVRKRLPKEVLSRRKRGFNIPFSRWVLHGLGRDLQKRFARDRIEARGLLSPEGVNRLLADHLACRADHRKPLFNLLALDLWCDRLFGPGAEVPLTYPS